MGKLIGHDLFQQRPIIVGKHIPNDDELCIYKGRTSINKLLGKHGYY